MFRFAGSVMSTYVEVVSQTVSVVMLQVLRWHMRSRLNASHSLLQDNMSTMHDILDAQWMYDNYKDGNKKLLKLLVLLLLLIT